MYIQISGIHTYGLYEILDFCVYYTHVISYMYESRAHERTSQERASQEHTSGRVKSERVKSKRANESRAKERVKSTRANESRANKRVKSTRANQSLEHERTSQEWASQEHTGERVKTDRVKSERGKRNWPANKRGDFSVLGRVGISDTSLGCACLCIRELVREGNRADISTCDAKGT